MHSGCQGSLGDTVSLAVQSLLTATHPERATRSLARERGKSAALCIYPPFRRRLHSTFFLSTLLAAFACSFFLLVRSTLLATSWGQTAGCNCKQQVVFGLQTGPQNSFTNSPSGAYQASPPHCQPVKTPYGVQVTLARSCVAHG